MDNPLAHFIRRHRRFAVPLHIDPVAEHLGKRLTPEQLASIQSELSVSAMRASTAQRPVTATSRPGANAATISTTLRSSASSFNTAPIYTVGQPVAVTPSTTTTSRSTSSSITSSSATSTFARVLSTSSPSTSSVLSTTSEAPSTTSSLPQVITRTQAAPITSISNSLPTVVSEQSNQSSTSSSLSTGAVVGIVLAVLVGVVILGSLLGWVYRKFASRGYKSDSRWRKLHEDITPFTQEKDEYHDDVYGGAAAPIIGSRRALADQAGRDAGYPANRPMSEYQSNRAGLGSGGEGYGASDLIAYPAHPAGATYGMDAQGRPYNGQAGRVPTQIPYQDNYGYPIDKPTQAPASPPGSRQIAGPQLVPVPLGRPAPPRSYSDIAHREDYADEPTSAGLPYAEPDSYAYQPSTARTNERAGTAQGQASAGSPSLPAAHAQPGQVRRISGQLSDASLSPTTTSLAPMPLPTFAPLSPLSSSFDLASHSQPLAMYENEPARQKQLYGEVSAAAGFAEPKTPHSAGLNDSMRSNGTFGTGTTHSSFSATEHGVRLPLPPMPAPVSLPPAPSAPRALPPLTMPNPRTPYEHGRPLSPLVEVATPSTIQSVLPPQYGAPPMSSSSLGGHAGPREVNPFDRLAMTTSTSQRTLVAPHSAASSAGATGFPSARYPPPSPGGMSVPGSVSDSPRRWSGTDRGADMARRSRGESMFDGDDAYGGI